MSLSKEKPQLLWALVLIVVAVGVYYLIQGILIITETIEIPGIAEIRADLGDDVADLAIQLAGGMILVLAAITLIIAFLLYSGSNGGRVLLIIILVLAILGNVFGAFLGNLENIIWLAVAVACFVLVYRPEVRAYFVK